MAPRAEREAAEGHDEEVSTASSGRQGFVGSSCCFEIAEFSTAAPPPTAAAAPSSSRIEPASSNSTSTALYPCSGFLFSRPRVKLGRE